MKLLSKIVWAEGMYLAPHHFQAQNRYFEEAMHFATASLGIMPMGLPIANLMPMLCAMGRRAASRTRDL